LLEIATLIYVIYIRTKFASVYFISYEVKVNFLEKKMRHLNNEHPHPFSAGTYVAINIKVK